MLRPRRGALRRPRRRRPAAQTQVPKIVALSMLGRHADAAACARAAQPRSLRSATARPPARVSLNLGTLHWRRGDYAEAARHSREAVLLFARVGDREHSVMADIGLADALTALGDLDEALRIYARARMRAAAHGLPVLDAIAGESVALLELARGRYREALAGLEQARRGYERLGHGAAAARSPKSSLATPISNCACCPRRWRSWTRPGIGSRRCELADEQAWTLAAARPGAGAAGAAREAPTRCNARRSSSTSHENYGRRRSGGAGARRAGPGGDTDDGSATLALAQRAVAGFQAAGQAERGARADACAGVRLLHLGRIGEARRQFEATLSPRACAAANPVGAACLTGLGRCAEAAGRLEAARDAYCGGHRALRSPAQRASRRRIPQCIPE